ncbi:helix-turn-helix domain-containing protein [Streptomyces sp. NBC_00564]|uniref:helix-turn-helix domain-containing protein n=1 Tax=Streptomyces sp. NBC_00564 TaxID=2903663 RepID=UPI00352EFC9E|nr:helix-turn-helix domain-containing protein [Streptomyces sp. NBC_00564]
MHGLRSRRGWTQEELSEKSGISIRTIRNLESGRIANPRRSSVDLLFAALDESGGPRSYQPFPLRLVDLAPAVESTGPEVPRPVARPWHGPRPPINSFIGRERDLAKLTGTVLDNRVTLLTGPGGVGKTRLALAAAETLHAHLDGPVFVLGLGAVPPETRSPILDVDDLVRADRGRHQSELSALLKAPPTGGGASVMQSLVVLDNAEHLPQAAAMFAEHLVRERPGTHVVITTRRAVPAPSAQVYEVAPLPADSPDALELLLSRVRSTCPALDLSHDLDAVRTLCRHLEGIPRTIEFAAEKLRAIPVGRLMTDVFGTHELGCADPSTLPHQRSLSGSVRWSLELLDDRHRTVLRVLVGMRSPFTIDEVERELAHSDLSSSEIFDVVAELVESSLVHVYHGRQYTYHILTQVRAFAS